MDNYQAIMKMSREELRNFLYDVYTTGLNTGMYASGLSEAEQFIELDKTPFNLKWLESDAESAFTQKSDNEDDKILLNALVESVFKVSGINIESIKGEQK